MGDAAEKNTRRILRQVQEHLTKSRLEQGVVHEQAGLVDVLHHPTVNLPALNYITPRKNTAWISAKDVQIGFEALKNHQRTPRIEYLDGLYPPRFAESLETIGLEAVNSAPLLVYQAGETPFKVPSTLDGVHITTVDNVQGSALWWYVWRNSYYEVVTHTADPVFIGQDLWKISEGTQIDLIMYRYRFPVGVARVNLYKDNKTAQITALTVMKEVRNEASVWLLASHAVQSSIKQGCSLIFTSAQSEDDRKLYRDHDFIDCGNMLCYAEKKTAQESHDPVAQPVPTHI